MQAASLSTSQLCIQLSFIKVQWLNKWALWCLITLHVVIQYDSDVLTASRQQQLLKNKLKGDNTQFGSQTSDSDTFFVIL